MSKDMKRHAIYWFPSRSPTLQTGTDQMADATKAHIHHWKEPERGSDTKVARCIHQHEHFTNGTIREKLVFPRFSPFFHFSTFSMYSFSPVFPHFVCKIENFLVVRLSVPFWYPQGPVEVAHKKEPEDSNRCKRPAVISMLPTPNYHPT